MAKEYYIQILDGATDQIVYFDRMKTYRSTNRVITSLMPVKRYLTKQEAESDVKRVRRYYHGQYLIEIIEKEFAECISEDCIF